MRRFGLIGRKLSHSFSQKYFQKKFKELDLLDHHYDLFEIDSISLVNEILNLQDLQGLNVTVPYKEEIIPFLNELDDSAKKVGAVNVVKIVNGNKIGYNSDYYGFKQSLEEWLPTNFNKKALVLGTGGASKAVTTALSDLKIEYKCVSRNPIKDEISYSETDDYLNDQFHLIINTTPLGMSPNINSSPEINYNLLTNEHYLYDLVYNPEITLFLKLGESQGASVKNGLEMLHLQAEESWRIWNSKYGV